MLYYSLRGLMYFGWRGLELGALDYGSDTAIIAVAAQPVPGKAYIAFIL
jgi:hypothetical protein